MKNIFYSMVLGLSLMPLAGFAQERFDLGPSVGILTSRGITTYGARFHYQTPDGLSIPLSIEFGDGIQKYTAGLGARVLNSEKFALSIGAALGNIQFDPKYDLENQERVNSFTALFQNELRIQLSKNIALGFHADIDLLNGLKVVSKESDFRDTRNYPGLLNQTHLPAGNDANGVPMWYSNYTGDTFYADYNTKAEFDAALENEKQVQRLKGMTSLGVSLKIDIFSGKKKK